MNYKILKAFTFLIIFFLTMMVTAQSNLIDLVNSYSADKRALDKFYIHNESEEYYLRYVTFYSDWKDKIKALDFESMVQQEKVDYILLKNLIEKESYFLNLEFKAYKEVGNVADFTKDLFPFIQERRRGKKPDAQTLAKKIHLTTLKIDAEVESLNHRPFKDWLKAEKASQIISSFNKSLKEAYSFYYGYDPEFTWWVEKPFEKLSEKLTEYSNLLRDNFSKTIIKDDGSGIIGTPIGRDALIKSLDFEFIPYTPEEMIKTAEKQFYWCKEEMIIASKELGYGTDWKAALEYVKNTYVPVGEQPQVINDLYNQSVDFIEEHDLITFPTMAKETWGMIMMTPEHQKINPFFTGGWEISISYPTNEMEEDDKLMSMRGNNPNFSRATVQHELLPGHNLQFFMNSRHKNYRKAFGTPFWMEGWALYWEINLWNKEFPQTPEQKLGMLFWRIHRCARIIFSLKYHLGEMAPQECIDMLVNEVGHEYSNAEAEVRRSFATSYTPPLYQMAYMIGGLQFYALRNEMLSLGWTEKQFHDRVLRENVLPVELLRSLILDLPLKKDYKTKWKFSTEFK